MADSQSFQERTEAPTPRRREQAREEGQVPRSPELTTAVMLLAAAGAVSMGGPRLGRALTAMLGRLLAASASPPQTIGGARYLVADVAVQVGAALTPILLALAVAALTISAAQARGILTTKPLAPKLERVSPLANAKRLFGVRPLADLLKSLLKLGVIGAVLYPLISRALQAAADLSLRPPAALGAELQQRVVRLLLSAGMAYLAVALADYLYQVWQHERQLKMSREDVKREHKEQEGDVMIKARRRSMGRQRARQRMFKDVPDADVVVTNPTHVAVAIRYRPAIAPAPIIVAMGQRKVAERIKAMALDAGVPVIENRPLARALLATGRVGEPIPTQLYVAVAEVLAFVIRRRRSLGLDEVVS